MHHPFSLSSDSDGDGPDFREEKTYMSSASQSSLVASPKHKECLSSSSPGTSPKMASTLSTAAPVGGGSMRGHDQGRSVSRSNIESIDFNVDNELIKKLAQMDSKLDWLVARIKTRSLVSHRRSELRSEKLGKASESCSNLRGIANHGNISVVPPSPVAVPAPPSGSGPELVREHRLSETSEHFKVVASGDVGLGSHPLSPHSARHDLLKPEHLASRRPSNASCISRVSRISRPSCCSRGGDGSLIPNLSFRPIAARPSSRSNSARSRAGGPGTGIFARSDKRHHSGVSVRSANRPEMPGMFRNNLLARRIFERSASKNIEHVQQRIRALPRPLRSQRGKTLDSLYQALDDPSSSKVAWRIAMCLQLLVLLSVLVTFMQTVEEPLLVGLSAAVLETTFDVLFLAEICARFITIPSKINFFFMVYTWIDILAGLALVVRAAGGFLMPPDQDSAVRTILLCFVPIIRFLKILRHFETFNLLIDAVKITLEALPMLLYAVILITMSFASLIYLVEPREQFESPFRAVWFCLVTVTTVGYGDYSPSTSAGYAIVMVLIIIGVILMAVPIGIIGNTFNQVWNARDYSLLLSRTRSALHKWGYSAHDIPMLFKLVDDDGNGVLDLDEFCELVREMKIGLSEERIIALFGHLDKDGSGALDAREFALEIFPDTYIEAYGHIEWGGEEMGTLQKAATRKDSNDSNEVVQINVTEVSRKQSCC